MPNKAKLTFTKILRAAGLLSDAALNIPPDSTPRERAKARLEAQKAAQKAEMLIAYGGRCMCCGWVHLHQLRMVTPISYAKLRQLAYPEFVDGKQIRVLCRFCLNSIASDPQGLCAHERMRRGYRQQQGDQR